MSASKDPAGGERALLTDLYQLTMVQSYYRRGMTEPATFELFVRHLPPARRFLISCGLEPALNYLASLRFSYDDLAFLGSLGRFDEAFLDAMWAFRFTGEVWAIPRAKRSSPASRCSASRLRSPKRSSSRRSSLTPCCIATSVASKAARCVIAAAGRDVVDFSFRRDHGPGAAMKAARAAWIAGAAGTSNVLAGKMFRHPTLGTMAHSYVMAFDDERAAFRAYAEDNPEAAVLLVDTYDADEGIRHASNVGRDIASARADACAASGSTPATVALARTAHAVFDDAGLPSSGSSCRVT